MKNCYTFLFCLLLSFISIIKSYAQSEVEVFVNSRGTHSIKKFDGDGNYLGDFISSGSGGLISPEDVIFHPDGSIIVTGNGNSTIKRYHGQSGAYLGNFSSGYSLSAPSKMSIGWDSLIYVTQWGAIQNKVVRFDLNGNFVDEFTSIDAPNGLGHVWDEDKNFYIALFGSNGDGTVHKFDSLGNDLGVFINSNNLLGPTDIWFDENGDMLVQDWNAGKVLRYNSNGQYMGVFINGLTNPEGIAFLPNGNLLIGDWGVDAVHQINSSGISMGFFASNNGLADPNNVAIRISSTTSIKDVLSDHSNFMLYPNPTINMLYLEVSSESFELNSANVQVFSTEGQLVFQKSIEGINGKFKLPINNLGKGSYFLKMHLENQVLSHQFVVLK